MSTDTESLTPELAGVGTAALSVSVAETAEDDPYVIHGVALGSGDVTIGQSGTRKYWEPNALADAAESLEGRPLVKNHNNTADGRVGTVTKADFKPGVGVIYEAEIAPHYEDLAKDVASGIMEVSARVKHPDEDELETHEETDALAVERLIFDNLSIVIDGAAPSNTAQFGNSPDMSPTAGQQDAAESPAIAAASAGDDNEMATATLERSAEIEIDAIADDLAALDGVESETDEEETAEAGAPDADAEADDTSAPEPEPESELDHDGSDGEQATEFVDPEEAETETESEADVESEATDADDDVEADVPDEGNTESTPDVESEPTDATPDSEATPEHDDPETDDRASAGAVAALSYYSSTTMTEPEFTEVDEDAIEEMNDPVLAERETVEQLHEKADSAEKVDERLEELNQKVDVVDQVDDEALEELAETEDPVVLGEEELSEKEGLVEEVGTVFAEELAKGSQFTAEELTSKFTPAELREKLVGEEGDVGEELSETVSEEPEPEGETVESEELSESTEDVEREEAEELAREQVADELAEAGWERQAEKVRAGEMSLDELGVEIDY